jgi:AraC-like DNA-binding protein
MVEIFDNIRKLYRFSNPCEELADCIEFFSESCVEATKEHANHSCFDIIMFPSFTPTFWFNLGPDYHITMDNKHFSIPPGNGVVVIRDGITARHNKAGDYLYSIKFFPGGLERILGIDQSKLAGMPVPLNEIISPGLIINLKQADDFENRKKLCEDYFLKKLKPGKKRDHYLDFIEATMANYTATGMKYNVSQLSEKMFTTSKTINRYFQKVIGTTPKHYFSLTRNRKALTAFIEDKKNFSCTEFGYYDMSHFYKEIRNFTGQSMQHRL